MADLYSDKIVYVNVSDGGKDYITAPTLGILDDESKEVIKVVLYKLKLVKQLNQSMLLTLYQLQKELENIRYLLKIIQMECK